MASTQTSLDLGRKVTCYLSAEFLMGPQLGTNLINLGIEDAARGALEELGQDLDVVLACEEPGLGNGGLGRRNLPNCAEGTRLFNPIVVHAWNPVAPPEPNSSPSTPCLRCTSRD